MSLKHTLLIFCLIFSLTASAQYQGLGSWNVVTINLPGSTEHRWGGYLEAQNRNYGLTSKFYYYEAKGGVSYNLDKNNVALLGIGRYVTYDEDDVDNGPMLEEFRFWEQFVSNQYLGRIRFEHRYRIEQRWFNTGYRNRFRYRFSSIIPFNKKKVEPGALYSILYDELFFNNKQPHFERNRVALLLGYQFSKQFAFTAGLLNQFNNTATGTNRKYYLHLNAIYNIVRK
ncbi:DUF2490 domain-containing protein [Mucilaginibacter daejeonensis]|uniref:DUF2490 domain-containing protein n=1 Tax=Mucilaginibacter daejeonensis TaxID=398049 RepID=UPI001D1715D0|nr:DUF2490 domain-containing protein [Mucilaginibacter daejeonensis]UEG52625.1 DUF2490 domain-containing protein [Mucilaginibacter daejeonensis]